jgi:N-acetylglutamate synthase-like GNAT family acetyltransferase
LLDVRTGIGQSVSVPKYTIRSADTSDVDVLRDLFRRASLSNDGDRDALLANPDALAFDDTSVHEQRTRVAIADGRIVGFATTQVTAGFVELDDLFVDPDWMRRGVGRALVFDAATTARSRGATRVEVTANGHALSFYEAAGFVLDGVTETRFGPGLRMHLDVAT